MCSQVCDEFREFLKCNSHFFGKLYINETVENILKARPDVLNKGNWWIKIGEIDEPT